MTIIACYFCEINHINFSFSFILGEISLFFDKFCDAYHCFFMLFFVTKKS